MRFFLLTAFAFGLILSGCQQMTEDEELSVIPATNNPLLIQDPNRGFVPGACPI